MGCNLEENYSRNIVMINEREYVFQSARYTAAEVPKSTQGLNDTV